MKFLKSFEGGIQIIISRKVCFFPKFFNFGQKNQKVKKKIYKGYPKVFSEAFFPNPYNLEEKIESTQKHFYFELNTILRLVTVTF